MKKLYKYEEYAQALAAFRQKWRQYATNDLFLREELTALIDAGKLYYAEIDGTLKEICNLKMQL